MVNLFLGNFSSQIEGQPDQLSLLAERWNEIRFLASTLRGEIPSPFHLSFTGCGDSLQVAKSGALMIQHHVSKDPHIVVLLSLTARDAFQQRFYHLPYPTGSRILFSISASGETPQTVKAQSTMSERGWFTFALTNRPLCSLTEQSYASFSMNIDTISSMHAVTTTSAAIWTIQSLAANLMEPNPQAPGYAEAYHALQKMPSILRNTLSCEDLRTSARVGAESFISKLMAHDGQELSLGNSIPILSGGSTMPAARLIALKLGELAALSSVAYNIEEFIHSPLNTITPNTPLVILIPDKNVYGRAKQLADFLKPYGNLLIEIAPERFPALTEHSIQLRLPVELLPTAYLGIPMLLAGELLVFEVASRLKSPPVGWRYGEEHAKLINQA